MPSPSLDALRASIREHYVTDESALARRLLEEAETSPSLRSAAQAEAADFVKIARANAARSGLIDKFLQEYGLSTAEGVTLMRLAEALLRTPDAATADALIRDKVEAGDWAAHKGKSPFPLVNFSTRALMLTAAWLDDVEGKDPARRIVKATKEILDRVGEPVIRAAVAQAMKIMGEHFVLGETIEAALKRARPYIQRGYAFSYDMLGEAAHTAKDAGRYFDDYATAIRAIGDGASASHPVDNSGISIKLSALHPRYEYSKRARTLEELGERINALAHMARNANIGFSIDAEEAARLDISLDLIEAQMRDSGLAGWDGFGVVIQAYQRRAAQVIDWLAALARQTRRKIAVRLVKGAYWDAEIKRAQMLGLESYPVFTRKTLTDISYIACVKRLFANADIFFPQFATHNALTASLVRQLAEGRTNYEVQRLHGMGEALHDSLLERGVRSRIYAPVGGHKELLPYLVRRLLENGANSSFVNQLIDPDTPIHEVVADPIAEVSTLETIPNPAIPAPRDLFSGERLSAKGWDIDDPMTALHLERIVVQPIDINAFSIVSGRHVETDEIQTINNPASPGDRIGHVANATARIIDEACNAAHDALGEWRQVNASVRSRLLRRAADTLESRAESFIPLIVREAGRSIPDAVSEVREAVDFLRYYAAQSEMTEGDALGVIACISPWNFPLAIFLGQIAGALAAGNTVVAKPAEQTPLIAFKAIKLLHEAGVPHDVLHFTPGDGQNAGAPLVAHPHIAGVVFTGSIEVAQIINRSLVDAGKIDAALIAETGGVNAMIVDSTALLEQCVTDVIASAFQSAGQRCSSCRIVCVQHDVADRFCEMLHGAMAELDIGDPAFLKTDVGPLIDTDASEAVMRHIKKVETSARVIARASANAPLGECFVLPVAVEIGSVSDLKREVFGPVLHVVRYRQDELHALVDEINALGYGLTLGAHTRIDETMHEIAARARAGNIYINRNQIGAVVGVQPFGGEGLSGTGPKAGGPHYVAALKKRRLMTDSGEPVSCPETAPEKIVSMERAFLEWSLCADRAGILERAAAAATGEARAALAEAARLCRLYFMEATVLPGPTGESNTMRLRGRGVVACLGSEPFLGTQIAKTLAAGNALLAPTELADPLTAALAAAGAPSGLVAKGGVTDATLADSRLRAIAFDGCKDAAKRLRSALSRRSGPICPLLSAGDALWRYGVERTLTINTTAAGGDVRLLSLAD